MQPACNSEGKKVQKAPKNKSIRSETFQFVGGVYLNGPGNLVHY